MRMILIDQSRMSSRLNFNPGQSFITDKSKLHLGTPKQAEYLVDKIPILKIPLIKKDKYQASQLASNRTSNRETAETSFAKNIFNTNRSRQTLESIKTFDAQNVTK